jgi:hypothetical protein
MASVDPVSPGFVHRLRARHGRRAAVVLLVLFAALVLQNAYTWGRNQRELPVDEVDEMDEWFHVKSRDLEHVASENPRFTVFGRIAIFYFLEQRIGGKTLTIPDWWDWARWELERVARLDVEVRPPMTVTGFQARRLRHLGEKRRFQQGSRRRARMLDLIFIKDPRATRFVLVESTESTELFVMSEERYAKLQAAVVPPP